MLCVPGKLFRIFTPKEICTEYVQSLMRNGDYFMIFVNNMQILINEECDEWIMNHGASLNIPRICGHHIVNRWNGIPGYVLTYTEGITYVPIPDEIIRKPYADFIKEIEEMVA